MPRSLIKIITTMGLFSPTFETLRDLYLNELRDLYSAETQLVEALPKMADAATSSQLKEAFTAHLEETEGHVTTACCPNR
jgi:ferritin-like metal-binding protein YciE